MCVLDYVDWPAWLTAVFAGLTVLVYLRMNRILTETNRISEAMVRETRRNRYAAVAPMVELRLGASVETSDGRSVRVNEGMYVVRATNISAWKAYGVEIVEPSPEPSSARPRDLDPKKGTEFTVRKTLPEPERHVVSYRDVFGNRWETIYKDGLHTPRLVEEAE